MKLSEYYRMMAEIDRRPLPEDDPRVKRIDLDFKEGKGKEGSATITFLDDVPVYLNWYIWSLNHEWMVEQIEKTLGKKIKLSNFSGGNGHESADLEIVEDTVEKSKENKT